MTSFPVHLQINLGDTYKVTGTATQGGDGLSEWVTSYKLEYTVDGSTWQYYGQASDLSGQRLSVVGCRIKCNNVIVT